MIANTVATAARILFRLLIVSPLMSDVFLSSSHRGRLNVNQTRGAKRICETGKYGRVHCRHCEERLRRSNPSSRSHGLLRGPCHRARVHATRWLAMTGKLPLPLRAHKVEIAAFVGLENGLVEQMRIAAFGPVRRHLPRKRGTGFFQLRGADQQINASVGDRAPSWFAGPPERKQAPARGSPPDLKKDRAARRSADPALR